MPRLARPLAVALLSAGTLAYEILLVRVFAIEQFHHFAYMAIGVAMLGFGASGTLWALAGRPERATRWLAWAAVLAAGSLVASPALAHRIELDPTQLAWDLRAWPRLALLYLLLALPFGAGALAILLTLTAECERPGRIYGASFWGAGLGAALALAILWLAPPARALALPATLASLGALAAARGAAGARLARAGAWLAVAVGAGAWLRPPWRLHITPYKALPQVEAYPDARRLAERTSPVGWVVAVQAPAFRYAPGLSLAFRGDFPRQTALFVDAQIADATAAWQSDSAAARVLDWLPSALPYALGDRERVLVLGAGGGSEVWNALTHRARWVTAVELQPDLVRLATGLAPLPPAETTGARVEWVVGDARSYVARSRERFDLVTLGPAGGFGTTAAGVYSLSEDFLHTVDAYVAYLERLSDRGVLAVTRWLTVPPRANVRVILTAAEALRRVGAAALPRGLVVVRSWGTATVMVKPAGFSASEIAALGRWATERRFDLDWYPGLGAPAVGFNLLDEPTLFRAAAAAVSGPAGAARFAATYPFAVAPVDDARPYPHHFLRTRSLGAFLRSSRGNWLPFAEWGYVALLATLCQSVVLAGLLTLAPVAIRRRPGRGAGPRWLALVGYFAAIGLAYLAAEIAAIQQLSLLLGHPVYAVAAVLAALLGCSGAGSAWSDRLAARRGWIAAATLAALLALYAALLLGLVHRFEPAPLAVRAAVAVFALVPPACLMGFPFPLGLRALAGTDGTSIAWAWAANGFASVVAAPLAALVALEAGSPALFLVAAGGYAAAAGLLSQPLGFLQVTE